MQFPFKNNFYFIQTLEKVCAIASHHFLPLTLLKLFKTNLTYTTHWPNYYFTGFHLSSCLWKIVVKYWTTNLTIYIFSNKSARIFLIFAGIFAEFHCFVKLFFGGEGMQLPPVSCAYMPHSFG